jgi:hypothetical protein
MRRIAVLAAVSALVALVALGVVAYLHGRPIQIRPGDVVSVSIFAVPEGPLSQQFERSPTNSGSRPLSLISASIPAPLPHPAWQFRCSGGGTIEIELQDGRTISYGPCRRPKSINHLWAVIIDVLLNGRCRPSCGPSGEPGP